METIKVLGQANANAVNTVIYTVPAGKAAVISLLNVVNAQNVVGSLRAAVNVGGGAGMAGAALVAYDLPLSPNEVVELLRGATLQAGASVAVWGSNANVVFNLFGSEVDA